MKGRPRSIRLFLAEGSPNGLIVATIPNWSGCVVLGRNADLPALLARDEANRPGVYVLYGRDDDGDDLPQAYIGQASTLKTRLTEHARSRDWWHLAAIISTTDTNFATSHFLSLESQLIALARNTNRCRLDNNVNPSGEAGRLGEADQADVASFLEDVQVVLPTLGIDIFRPTRSASVLSDAPKAIEQEPPTFVMFNGRTKLATAILSDGDFVVLAGSTAMKNAGHQSARHVLHKRQPIIDRGDLEDKGDHYEFLRDVVFRSPSGAAAAVLERSSNGRTEWKHERTLADFASWENGLIDEHASQNEPDLLGSAENETGRLQ